MNIRIDQHSLYGMMGEEMVRDWTKDEVRALVALQEMGVLTAFSRVISGSGGVEAIRQLGHGLWLLSYGAGLKEDTESGPTVGKSVQGVVTLAMAALMGVDPDTVYSEMPPSEIIQGSFAAHWVDQACPEIVVGHKYAAALMSTKIGKDTMDYVRPPWRAFLLRLPNGLLHLWNERTSELEPLEYIGVFHRYNDYRERFEWAYYTVTSSGLSMWRFGISTEQLLMEEVNDNPYKDHAFCDEMTSIDQRTSLMIGRLIVNTCIAMTDRKQVKAIGKSHHSNNRPGRSGPPLVRVFQVGRKITINCIDAVKDYVAHGSKRGKSGPATVQTLVCGHHKMQPFGPKTPEGKWGPQRKLIWREPFWRGQEDAPIVTRPHRFKTGDSQEKEC